MKIVRMDWGEAPNTADRVFIQSLPGGFFGWSGSIGSGSTAIYTTGNGIFSSAVEAEAAAVEWARAHFVSDLIIETEGA